MTVSVLVAWLELVRWRPRKKATCKVKETHQRISQNRPELISDLTKVILGYVEKIDELDSSTDGHKILKSWILRREFEEECRDCQAKQVFGIILRDTLTDIGWQSDRAKQGNRTVTIYYSPDY